MAKPNRAQRVQWWLTDGMLAATEVSGERMVIGIVAGLLVVVAIALLCGAFATGHEIGIIGVAP